MKSVLLGSDRVGSEEDAGGGFMSRIDTLADFERRRDAVARPKPELPPEIM